MERIPLVRVSVCQVFEKGQALFVEVRIERTKRCIGSSKSSTQSLYEDGKKLSTKFEVHIYNI